MSRFGPSSETQGQSIKVAEHCFGSLWVYVSSQAETWQVKNVLMKDFEWQVKFDVVVVSMAIWTIESNIKISL